MTDREIVNKIYDDIIDKGNEALNELYDIAPHAIEYSNQLKPVRVLDKPEVREFFLKLIEV